LAEIRCDGFQFAFERIGAVAAASDPLVFQGRGKSKSFKREKRRWCGIRAYPTSAVFTPRGNLIDLCENRITLEPQIRRILVIRLGAMGDVVRTLPAVSALRAGLPEAQITWLVEPVPSSILAGQPWIDEVLIFPRAELMAHLRHLRLIAFTRCLSLFLRELRSRQFELVVDFHSIFKSGLLSRLSGAARRVAYARPFGREGSWLFATDLARLRLPASGSKIPRFQRNLGLVRFLGIEADEDVQPLRLLPESESGMAQEPLEGGPVAIHPGTSYSTPYKRYTIKGYAEVARALYKSLQVPVIVTVGPAQDDRAFAEAIVSESQGAAVLAPQTSALGDLAALFARCSLYIGSDTGPMHVASLVGTPVLQLLGPTHPIENAPYGGTPSKTLRVPQPCSPCRRGCAEATCMKAIEPERVIAAALELLCESAASGSKVGTETTVS
jgi:ADP-heptose:LPS heptosyltransferase